MDAVDAIRHGLAERVATIPGMRAHPRMHDQLNPPCTFVLPPEHINFDYTCGGGSHAYRFVLRTYVGKVDEKGAQDRLDRYASPTGTHSIRAAIEGDPSLGGRVDLARVEQVRNYGPYQSGPSQFLGMETVIFVVARPA